MYFAQMRLVVELLILNIIDLVFYFINKLFLYIERARVDRFLIQEVRSTFISLGTPALVALNRLQLVLHIRMKLDHLFGTRSVRFLRMIIWLPSKIGGIRCFGPQHFKK